MNYAIAEIRKNCAANQAVTAAQVLSQTDQYFSKIVWSLEKAEWNRMTTTQKNKFVKEIVKSLRK